MSAFFFVGVGGALGAVCRYGLSLFAARILGVEFAWGTLGAMSEFTGVGRSDVPEAELWFGDH